MSQRATSPVGPTTLVGAEQGACAFLIDRRFILMVQTTSAKMRGIKTIMVVEGETAMSERKGYRVAVVGATGAVGQQMIHTLESRDFPVSELLLLSSSRSAGTKVQYKGKELTVQELSQKALKV